MLKEIERGKPVAEKVADQSVSCVVTIAENIKVTLLYFNCYLNKFHVVCCTSTSDPDSDGNCLYVKQCQL